MHSLAYKSSDACVRLLSTINSFKGFIIDMKFCQYIYSFTNCLSLFAAIYSFQLFDIYTTNVFYMAIVSVS